MKLPKLPREPIRPEEELPPEEKEIWQPKWRCFCCEDTGKVSPTLARLVIPDYNYKTDKNIACQNPRCHHKQYLNDANYDQRFTSGICVELDKINREDWQNTAKIKFEKIQQLAKKKAMKGVRDRTFNDEREMLIRKEEAQAAMDKEFARVSDE